MAKKLGIDLGTTNTLVFVPGRGIVLNEPSVVAVSEDNKILAIGAEAKLMIGRTPESITAYRPMKDGVIADYRVTEAMLRYYINKALGRWNIFKPDVLISVPAGVTSTERRAVVEAAIKGHMIGDIGGGTTDVAVISLGGIVASTSVKVAGNKIDTAIADYIKKNFNLVIGDKTAEDIKIAIGSAIPLNEELVTAVKGRDFVLGLPRTIEVKTNEVTRAMSKELREMIKAVKEVLQETPPELSSDIIDRGIIMTGGSSQLRNFPELMLRRTGVKAVMAKDAYYCVAKGTGIALEHLSTYKKSIIAKR